MENIQNNFYFGIILDNNIKLILDLSGNLSILKKNKKTIFK